MTTPSRRPDDAWKKRHALHIAAQLPDGLADALDVLRFVRQIVDGYLGDEPKPEERVRLLRGLDKA